MDETRHETSDGSKFRIDRIQTLNVEPMVKGVTFTFSVEAEDASEDEPARGFEVAVHLSPIFISLLTVDSRGALVGIGAAVAQTALEYGVREPVEVKVTSDGAVVLHGRVIDQLLPLRKPA